VTKALMYLASDDARYVTGISLPVDAGSTIR
jgi:(+)-trans-carveol dehydrogenase